MDKVYFFLFLKQKQKISLLLLGLCQQNYTFSRPVNSSKEDFIQINTPNDNSMIKEIKNEYLQYQKDHGYLSETIFLLILTFTLFPKSNLIIVLFRG